MPEFAYPYGYPYIPPGGTPSIYLGKRIPYPLFFIDTLEGADLFLPRVALGKAGKQRLGPARPLSGHSHHVKRAENRLSTRYPQNAGMDFAREYGLTLQLRRVLFT